MCVLDRRFLHQDWSFKVSMTWLVSLFLMQTQHKIEMDKRDGKFKPQPMMGVPSVQHMSRIDQALFSLITDVFEGLLCSLQKDHTSCYSALLSAKISRSIYACCSAKEKSIGCMHVVIFLFMNFRFCQSQFDLYIRQSSSI